MLEPQVWRWNESGAQFLFQRRRKLLGADQAFGPGEAFLIKPGFRGTWESIGRVTKIYAILDAD